MKLHLPKSLLAGVLYVFACAVVPFASADTITVSTYSNEDTLPSSAGTVTHTGDLTLGNAEVLGAYTTDGVLIDFSDYGTASTYGKQQWEKPLFGSWSATLSGNVSQNVNITGTLTINDTARVVLGGQYRTSSTVSTKDEYTGIIVNAVVVNGSGTATHLETTNLTANSLTVNSGKVSIHTNGNYKQGNTHFVVFDSKDSKQVSIRESLNINGGNTTIGNSTGDKLQTAFGKLTYSGDTWLGDTLVGLSSAEIHASQIRQTSGALKVEGDSVSVGGLNINQTGGSMSISNGAYHDLADYGDSKISQNSLVTGTVLNIGTVRAYNSQYDIINGKLQENGVSVELSPSIELSHSGVGTINMSGANFTEEINSSSQKSTITQNDYVDAETGKVTTTTGAINLNGEYKGVTFDISQTGGGNINLNADIQAGAVKQSGTGTITVASDKTLNAESIEISGGTLVNNGTVSVASSEPAMLLAAGDDVTTLDNTEDMMNITITGGQVKNYGVLNGDISVQGGVLELLAGNVGDITMTVGEIIVQSNSITGNLTLNGGTITFAEGAVLTLSGDSTVALNGASVIVQVSADTLAGLEQGSNVTLFDVGTGTLDFNNTVVTFVNGEDSVQAIVSGAAADSANGGQVIVNAVIPEPTTATLSLLALAALAARRRRC